METENKRKRKATKYQTITHTTLSWPGLPPNLPLYSPHSSLSSHSPLFFPNRPAQLRAQVLKGAFRVRGKVFGQEQEGEGGVSSVPL